MRHAWAGLIGALILACASLTAAAAPALAPARDLRAEAAQAARQGAPLILLFSRADCSFCKTVRRDYLLPLQARSRAGQGPVIREIGQDTEQPLIDFSGQRTTHSRFAAQQKVTLVPVVAFYGPQGQALAEPIVGARLPDFYADYLEQALLQAARQLRR